VGGQNHEDFIMRSFAWRVLPVHEHFERNPLSLSTRCHHSPFSMTTPSALSLSKSSLPNRNELPNFSPSIENHGTSSPALSSPAHYSRHGYEQLAIQEFLVLVKFFH
jgi:hypothetical protein